MTARRWLLAGIGTAFLVAGLVVANLDLVVADTSCGSVFSDSNWGFVCHDTMSRTATATAVLLFLGLLALGSAALFGRHGRDLRLAVAASGLAFAGFGLALIAANRLAEPLRRCGSVLSPYRYDDATKERACDVAQQPMIRQAVIAGAFGLAAMAGAVVMDRRRRRGLDQPGPDVPGATALA